MAVENIPVEITCPYTKKKVTIGVPSNLFDNVKNVFAAVHVHQGVCSNKSFIVYIKKNFKVASYDLPADVDLGYEHVDASVSLKKEKKELRKAARKAAREDEAASEAAGEPSYGDVAVAAMIRARANIARSLGGDLSSEKIDPSDAKRIQNTRTGRASKQDACRTNKRASKQPDLQWVLYPGSKDVPGVDGPGYCFTTRNGTKRCVQKKSSKFPKACKKKY